MTRDFLRQATRFRYGLPVMAELSRAQGCKFVTLIRRLNASDRAIRQSLDHLIEIGWVMPNPGYGHPMRPEYILTEEGERIGARAERVWSELQETGIALERWPLLLLAQIEGGKCRFSELKQACAPISPRALTLALKRLVEAGLINRKVTEGFPPATEYEVTPRGEIVASL